MKTCVDCGRQRPLDDYHKNPGYPDGLQRRCKFCARRLARYGLTDESFNALIHAQGGVCALCRVNTPNGRGRWHVDHDHSCCPGGHACANCIRGLLCMSCYQFLGKYEKWHNRVEEYLSIFRKRK